MLYVPRDVRRSAEFRAEFGDVKAPLRGRAKREEGRRRRRESFIAERDAQQETAAVCR